MDVDEGLSLLPVLPWSLAALSLVLVVALAVPPGGPRDTALRSGPSPVARRVPALLLLVLTAAAVAGLRLGDASELTNPVPQLLLGLGLPALLLLPAVLGPLARRVLPAPAAVEVDARPAAAVAVALGAALVLAVRPASPAALGTGLLAYAVVVGLAVVAVGRERAAGGVEVLGLLGRWAALGPRLTRWDPPRGALAVTAVLLGVGWAERYERSAAWAGRLAERHELAVLLAAALLLAAAGALLLARSVPGAAAVLLPLALGTAAAGAARRALVSAQLLVGDGAEPDLLGVVGGQLLALSLVALGGALSAAVLARRVGEGAARLPGTGVLLALSAVSAAVVLQP